MATVSFQEPSISLTTTTILLPVGVAAAENEASPAAWESKIPQRLRDRMNEPTMGAAFAFVKDDPRWRECGASAG